MSAEQTIVLAALLVGALVLVLGCELIWRWVVEQ